MINTRGRCWAVCITAVTLVFVAAGARVAQGQSGVCCPNTQGIPIKCDSPGCQGNVQIVECASGGYEGTMYQSVIVYCCTSPLSTLINPSGPCNTGAPVRPALSAQLIWVRNCRGRYVLLKLPVAV